MAFHPYLFFGGNCREAFTRYQQIFGGELVLLPMGEMSPGDDSAGEPVASDKAHLIMHAALKVDAQLLMGSDDPTSDTMAPVQGMRVNYAVEDPAEAKRAFDALAEGGQITLPIGETFFSPMFGMCVDRFGTPWMISTADPSRTG